MDREELRREREKERIEAGVDLVRDVSEFTYVPGVGPRPAKFMVVGEAPGRTEEQEGLPFVGKAGTQVLPGMLEAMGIDINDVYLTNVVKVRPPRKNDGSVTPSNALIEEWRDVLWQEVLEIQPKLIIALGKIPATEFGLNKLDRGFIHPLDGRYFGFDGVFTFHPASVFYSYTTESKIEYDCQKIRKSLIKRGWICTTR